LPLRAAAQQAQTTEIFKHPNLQRECQDISTIIIPDGSYVLRQYIRLINLQGSIGHNNFIKTILPLHVFNARVYVPVSTLFYTNGSSYQITYFRRNVRVQTIH
jgi:hypothetical protein